MLIIILTAIIGALALLIFYHYFKFKPAPIVATTTAQQQNDVQLINNIYEEGSQYFTPSYDPNIHIHYKTIGTGPKKILFIVGLSTNYLYWLPQVEYVMNNKDAQKEFSICVFDNRGRYVDYMINYCR